MRLSEVGNAYKISEHQAKTAYNHGPIAFRASPILPQPGSSVGFVNRHRSQFQPLVFRNGNTEPKDVAQHPSIHSSTRKVPILGAKSYSIEKHALNMMSQTTLGAIMTQQASVAMYYNNPSNIKERGPSAFNMHETETLGPLQNRKLHPLTGSNQTPQIQERQFDRKSLT